TLVGTHLDQLKIIIANLADLDFAGITNGVDIAGRIKDGIADINLQASVVDFRLEVDLAAIVAEVNFDLIVVIFVNSVSPAIAGLHIDQYQPVPFNAQGNVTGV